jgi:signal transduction histidine kinase
MLLCLITVGALTYFINRLYVNQKLAKQKAAFEKRYAIEQERARISAELHDDLGGNLSTIHLLSEIVKEKLHDNVNTRQISKISESSKELLSKLNEIVWSLNINNDTLDNLASYLREQSAKMLSEANLLYTFHITEQIPPLKINGTVRRHILLLVKEALHNIIKHANATHITFCIAANETLEIMIQDNGKGISSECIKTSKGNGINNMQKHAGAIDGTLNIENGEGTKIKLAVELKKLSLEDVL